MRTTYDLIFKNLAKPLISKPSFVKKVAVQKKIFSLGLRSNTKTRYCFKLKEKNESFHYPASLDEFDAR